MHIFPLTFGHTTHIMTEKGGDGLATLKCKYCGGNVAPLPEGSLGACASCGAVMTLPRSTSKEQASAHNCGNYLRRAGKFDKALAVYQTLLAQDATDAESCWCSALCRFGVQYVEEGGIFRPVVLRPEAGKFLECPDYLAAVSLSQGAQRQEYEKEAKRIAQVLGQVTESAPPPSPMKQGFELLRQGAFEEADQCFCQGLAAAPEDAMGHLGRLLAECRCTSPKGLPGCGQAIAQSPHYKKALEYADGDLKKYLLTAAKKTQGSRQSQAEAAYRRAREAMEAACTNEEYRQAARMFAPLGNYGDARARAQECLARAEALRKEAVYRAAGAAMGRGDAAGAAKLYSQIPGWRDANIQAVQCQQRAVAQKAAKGEPEHFAASVLKRIGAAVLVLAVLIVSGWLFVNKYLIPQKHYQAAEALLEAGNREEAIEAFQALGDFKDASQRAQDTQADWYSQAQVLLSAGDSCRAAAIFGGLRDYSDARERSRALWAEIVEPERIAAGGWFTAALRSDRMAHAAGDNREGQCQVGTWMSVDSISAGWEHTVGLRTDGTVLAAGYNGDGRGDVEGWRDMVAISAGQWHTVGLKSNGRVLGLGCDNDGRIDLDGWRDIIGISAGRNHTIGLKADRTALAVGINDKGQCNVEKWSNLRAISAGGEHSLGLTREGTVLTAGSNAEGQCGVDGWTDIVAVAAGYYHSVGLKSDGTVVAVGFNEYGQCDVGQWTDIVAICAGGWHTVGLKADGTLVAVGRNKNGQCDVLEWSSMLLP